MGANDRGPGLVKRAGDRVPWIADCRCTPKAWSDSFSAWVRKTRSLTVSELEGDGAKGKL